MPVLDAVVQRAKSDGVDTVLIGGEAVLLNGRFTRIDEAAAIAEFAHALGGSITEDERHRRSLAMALMPHVEKYYQGYLADEPFEPYEHRHSRR